MKDPRNVCGVCRRGVAVARFVDAAPDLSAAELSRQAGGMDVSAASILTHRKHIAAEPPKRAPNQRKKDFAIYMRDRVMDAVEELKPIEGSNGEMIDPILNKELMPTVNAGLKAQAIIDSREKAKKSSGTAELAFAILRMLGGEPPLALDDGMTIEGDAVEVDGEAN